MLVNPFAIAPAAGGDPFWSDVILLMGFDEANGATSFADASPSGLTLVQAGAGGSVVSTATPKFGTGALANGGTTARARVAGPGLFNMTGAVPFTVEFWVRYAALPSNVGLLGFNINTTGSNEFQWGLNVTPSNILEFETRGTGGRFITLAVPTGLNTWHYIAACRYANGQVALWVNGAFAGISGTPASAVLNAPGASEMSIGFVQGYNGNANAGVAAQFDEVRVTKNVARYTAGAGIAVPTAAFPRG